MGHIMEYVLQVVVQLDQKRNKFVAKLQKSTAKQCLFYCLVTTYVFLKLSKFCQFWALDNKLGPLHINLSVNIWIG